MGPTSTAIVLGLSLGSAHAGSIPRASYKLNLPQYDLPMVDYQFPSGFRVVFEEDHNQPIVGVTLMLDTGSDMDPPGLDGIAHLIEHLNFRAEHGDLPKNMDVVGQLGAVWNATTWTDATNYLTVAPKDSLIPLLQLEAARLVDAVENVTEEMVDTEREVVRNELRIRVESSAGISAAWEPLMPRLFPAGHPYSHTTIGTHATLDNIKLADVQAYVKKNYVPANATLVVVGDIDLKTTQDIVHQAFDPYPELLVDPKDPKGAVKPVTLPPRVDCSNVPEPPPPTDTTMITVRGLVDKEEAVVAWALPGGYCGIGPSGNVAAGMLGYFIQQTLVPDWEYKPDADVPGIQCGFDELQHSSIVLCGVEAKAGYSGQRLFDKIGDALYLQWDKQYATVEHGYLESFLNEVRMGQMAGYLKAVDNAADIFGRATQTASHLHFTGSPMYFSDAIEDWSAFDYPQIERLATKYITRDRMVKVDVIPMDEEERARREAAAREGAGAANQYHATGRDDEYSMAFDLKSLTPEAIERVVLPPDTSKITSYALPNGLKVDIMPYGHAPLMRMGIILNGGYRTSAPWGLDLVGEELLARGTTQPERILAVAGSYGETPDSQNAASKILFVDGSSGNVDALLDKLRWEVSDMEWSWADRSEMIKAKRAALLREADKSDWWTQRVGDAALWGDHPLGRSVLPETWAAGREWPAEAVAAWMEAKYQPQNASLFIVGRIDDVADVRSAIEKYFGSWEGNGAPPLPATYPKADPAAPKTFVVSKPTITQTTIISRCQLPAWTATDYATGPILGDYLSEALWRRLREQAGITYGAYAYVQNHPGGARVLTLYALVQNDGVPLTLDTYERVLEDARAGKVDEGQLATLKWSRARAYPLGHTSTTQMLDRLMGVRAVGFDNHFFDWYPHALANVKAADLATMVAGCIGHEVTTIQGPLEYAEPALKERNMSYEVVDWEALLRAQMTPKEIKKRDKKAATTAAPS